MINTFEMGPDGGTFQPPLRGLPTDGVSLELPEHAVDQPITFSIGAEPQPRFRQPLRIHVTFRPDSKYQTLVGYAIDEQGRFHSIDLIDLDMKKGRVTFLTFQPLTLTWVYIRR